MSKETALQIAMRITQRYANSLFDEHTARGRQFMQEMSECLELEREQIEEALRCFEKTTPIQIPTDEEIGKEFKHYSDNWEIRQALEIGAKWMRDKIKGGEQ